MFADHARRTLTSVPSASGAAGELRQMLRENLESIHRDVLSCATLLTGEREPEFALRTDLDAAKIVLQRLSVPEIESLLIRSVIGLEEGMKSVRDRVALARAALERLVS